MNLIKQLQTALATGLVGAALVFSGAAAADYKVWTGWFSDTAIKGYDTVAYFTEGQPTKGSDDFTAQWSGATWKFANAEHLAKFEADPEKYAPQYGGHCAFAVAKGDLVKIDPEAWSIVDGKLYLNYSESIQEKWDANRGDFIARADQQWPEIGKR
ncbi:YHS domain protein [bacterium]|nr:YHS domain protein [bacterium]